MRKTSVLIALFLYTGSLIAGSTDSILTMPFDKKSQILYSLSSGAYDIIFNEKPVIKNAKASYTAARFDKYSKTTLNDAMGKGTLYTIDRYDEQKRMQQLFYVYPDKNFFFVQVKISGAANYISPLTSDELKMEGQGLVVPFDNDMWVRYEVQPLAEAQYTSSEVTGLINYQGSLIIGSIEHSLWKTGIRVQHIENNRLQLEAFGGFADSNTTHDKIPHGRVGDTICVSPKIMVGMFRDWRDGMEAYAHCNKLAEPPVIFQWNKATPMGWNSWGALQTKLNIQNAKAVIDFFHDSCTGFRNEDSTLYIDLDSYWDNMNDNQLKEFVTYCKSKHFKPGIYWAPFADWNKQGGGIDGTAYTYAAAWIRQKGNPVDLDGAYALDPTHPGARQRIIQFITRFKELGFEMIKVDFLGHAALESDRYFDNRITTGMQAYKAGMEFLDSVLNNSMLVYAAISPTMATARYVHMRRIACDAFSAIDNTEYTMNSTGYGWWQSHLYKYVDADHVVFKNETAGVNRARFVSALVTGTLITGDDFSVAGPWRAAAQQLLQNKKWLRLIKDGRAFRPLFVTRDKKAVDMFIKSVNGKLYLAAFNYDDLDCKIEFSLKELGLKKVNRLRATELFSKKKLSMTERFTAHVPAADVLLFEIEP